MDELVRWLRAQLDEDEQEAQDALKRATTTRRRIGGEWVEDTVQPPEWRRSVWGPARVLREIDAKRRVLDWYKQRAAVDSRGEDPDDYENVTGSTLETVVQMLALPYADRPGYRDEWRP